jgi:hypothetical protein
MTQHPAIHDAVQPGVMIPSILMMHDGRETVCIIDAKTLQAAYTAEGWLVQRVGNVVRLVKQL